MRKLIETLADSYFLSYMITSVVLFSIFATNVDVETAMAGSIFYSVFYTFFTMFLFFAIDTLLPYRDR